jgi:hypothetical protein
MRQHIPTLLAKLAKLASRELGYLERARVLAATIAVDDGAFLLSIYPRYSNRTCSALYGRTCTQTQGYRTGTDAAAEGM